MMKCDHAVQLCTYCICGCTTTTPTPTSTPTTTITTTTTMCFLRFTPRRVETRSYPGIRTRWLAGGRGCMLTELAGAGLGWAGWSGGLVGRGWGWGWDCWAVGTFDYYYPLPLRQRQQQRLRLLLQVQLQLQLQMLPLLLQVLLLLLLRLLLVLLLLTNYLLRTMYYLLLTSCYLPLTTLTTHYLLLTTTATTTQGPNTLVSRCKVGYRCCSLQFWYLHVVASSWRTPQCRSKAAGATTQTVASARTSERRHGPGRE